MSPFGPCKKRLFTCQRKHTSAESLMSSLALGMEDSSDSLSRASSCVRDPPLLPREDLLLSGSFPALPLPPIPSSCRRWWCLLGEDIAGWGGLSDVCCCSKIPPSLLFTSRAPTNAEASDRPRIDSCRRCSELWMSAIRRLERPLLLLPPPARRIGRHAEVPDASGGVSHSPKSPYGAAVVCDTLPKLCS